MSIYTKTGDQGTTSLIGGTRVSKADLRLEAYGTVDELTAQVAYLRDHLILKAPAFPELGVINEELLWILERLMTLGAELACEPDAKKKIPHLAEADIHRLETSIDRMQARAPRVFKFTLPGGHPLISLSHIARTVCRRSERAAVRLSEGAPVPAPCLRFLNRLSDYLYSLGRELALILQVEEIFWEPQK